MSDVNGTQGNDTIDGTNFPELTITDGSAGDDYIIVGRFGNADGGPGNDTIVGAVNAVGPGAVYWSSPKGIKVNFSTGKVEDGFGTIDTLTNIKVVQGSSYADTVLGGASGDNFWAGLHGDQIDGLSGKLVVSYYGRDPLNLKIEYSADSKEFIISDLTNSKELPDIIKNVAGINFPGNGYSYPLLTSSNLDIYKVNTVGFLLKSTSNLDNGDSKHYADSYIPGDFNGDGFQDFAVFRLNFSTNPKADIQILVGDGTGGFKDGTKLIFGNTVPFTNFVARALVADFNNDGFDDLFCIDTGADAPPFSGGQNKLLLSNGRGNLTDQTSKLPLIDTFNHGASIADVNGDGRLDIIINSLTSNVGTNLYIQDKSGVFATTNNLLPSAVVGSATMQPFSSTWSTLIDINLDGQRDLILGTWNPNQLTRLYFGDKSSIFQNEIYSELPPSGLTSEIVQQIQAIDLNGDELPDLAISTTNGDYGASYAVGYIQLLVNKGGGKFVDETQLRLPQSTSSSPNGTAWYKYLVITDLDRDGKSDIVTISDGGEGLKAYMNDGSGKFIKEFSRGYTQVYGAVSDLNNDGMDDFITSNTNASSLSTWLNNKTNGHIYKANFGGETLRGSATSDSFYSRDGNDFFDGRGGVDTAFYRLVATNYVIAKAATNGATSYTVKDKTSAEGADTLVNVERIRFSDKTVALDIDANAGQAYRIYKAAFNRTPDNGGLKYWIVLMDGGVSLPTVSSAFIASAEFKALYGVNPTNEVFISKLYDNVLHRAPDIGGYNYWVGLLNRKKIDNTSILINFSESPENQAGVIGVIQNGIELI